jgi:hypothetical protein
MSPLLNPLGVRRPPPSMASLYVKRGGPLPYPLHLRCTGPLGSEPIHRVQQMEFLQEIYTRSLTPSDPYKGTGCVYSGVRRPPPANEGVLTLKGKGHPLYIHIPSLEQGKRGVAIEPLIRVRVGCVESEI